MPTDLYNGFLMVVLSLVVVALGTVTIAHSWRQGNFVSISAGVALLFLGIAALVEQILGYTNISMILFGIAIAVFLFMLFVVVPMTFRRSKKKRAV